jgi:hypothetical protein
MAFKPKFYWTGNSVEDAERINRPHIKAEGPNEDRIADTIDILSTLEGTKEFTLKDVFNIQNWLLKNNNWKGVKPGLRQHNVSFEDTPDHTKVTEEIEKLFPVSYTTKEDLLEWYRKVQTIHPLSDLNGRTFGIIVAILYQPTRGI